MRFGAHPRPVGQLHLGLPVAGHPRRLRHRIARVLAGAVLRAGHLPDAAGVGHVLHARIAGLAAV